MLKIIKVYFQITHQIKGLGKQIAHRCKIRNAHRTASNPVCKRNEHHTRPWMANSAFTFVFRIWIHFFYYDDFLKILLVYQTYLPIFRLSICDHYSSSRQFETWISINKIVFMGLYYGSYYPMGPLILAHDNTLWISLPSEIWYHSTFDDVLSNLRHFHHFNSLHQTSVWTPILLQISFYPRSVLHDLCITESGFPLFRTDKIPWLFPDFSSIFSNFPVFF